MQGLVATARRWRVQDQVAREWLPGEVARPLTTWLFYKMVNGRRKEREKGRGQRILPLPLQRSITVMILDGRWTIDGQVR